MTQDKERDNYIINQLSHVARNSMSQGIFFYERFYDQALRILQEAEHQYLTDNNVGSIAQATDEVEEKLEFVPGELYEDREGIVYEYVGRMTQADSPLVFADKYTVQARYLDGKLWIDSDNKSDIIRRHVPVPKKHKVEFWVNVYEGGVEGSYESKKQADEEALPNRIASLRLEREITEGEGL